MIFSSLSFYRCRLTTDSILELRQIVMMIDEHYFSKSFTQWDECNARDYMQGKNPTVETLMLYPIHPRDRDRQPEPSPLFELCRKFPFRLLYLENMNQSLTRKISFDNGDSMQCILLLNK